MNDITENVKEGGLHHLQFFLNYKQKMRYRGWSSDHACNSPSLCYVLQKIHKIREHRLRHHFQLSSHCSKSLSLERTN